VCRAPRKGCTRGRRTRETAAGGQRISAREEAHAARAASSGRPTGWAEALSLAPKAPRAGGARGTHGPRTQNSRDGPRNRRRARPRRPRARAPLPAAAAGSSGGGEHTAIRTPQAAGRSWRQRSPPPGGVDRQHPQGKEARLLCTRGRCDSASRNDQADDCQRASPGPARRWRRLRRPLQCRPCRRRGGPPAGRQALHCWDAGGAVAAAVARRGARCAAPRRRGPRLHLPSARPARPAPPGGTTRCQRGRPPQCAAPCCRCVTPHFRGQGASPPHATCGDKRSTTWGTSSRLLRTPLRSAPHARPHEEGEWE